MKAARFHGPKQIEVAELSETGGGPDEIVVEVHRAGIRGTDLRIDPGRK